MITASIITIGDELLIGQVIDTNSCWMAQQLNKAGIPVKRRVAVGDVWNEIWNSLDEEAAHADIILLTGGLGPTADDITKPLLCEYFKGKMIVNEEALAFVLHLFEKIYKKEVTEVNRKQAEVPDTCTVIQNQRGTAPGMWFEKEGKIFISMPGVPYEMMDMMETSVIPALISRFTLPHIVHRTLVTIGIGESALAALIQGFETTLPAHIKLAYLPNHGLVRLRLSAISENKTAIENESEILFQQLQSLVAGHLVTAKDESMQEVIGNMLLDRKKTLCTAESCTGGFIAHLITASPGASAYFNGSVVSYSYKAKVDLLAVENELLIEKGAVSEAVVIQMARGALDRIQTDYAIAVSGIMGPDGGMPDKPAGTVWVAVGNKQRILTKKFHFRFNRSKNIELTAMNALNLLRVFILEEEA